MTSTPAGSHRAVIVETLRLSSLPLDDDQLSQRTQIRPRQTVNQICRRLQLEGLIDRVSGPEGKIVNVLRRSPIPQAGKATKGLAGPAPLVDEPLPDEPAGHSREQRAAEFHLLEGLSRAVGRSLAPTVIRLPSGVRVEVDGADSEQSILVECWAHIGKVKGAQRLKILTDAFKLTWIANNIPGRPRLVLCMGDHEAAAPFINRRAWYGQALADQGVEVIVVSLPEDIRSSILRAQQRQYR
jgi:hypothetical protein